jgi:uncharacterized protein YceK
MLKYNLITTIVALITLTGCGTVAKKYAVSELPRGQSNLFCFSKTLHSFVAFSLRARLTKLCA